MISIIITAYKEEKTIGKAIGSFLNNPLPEKYEILVFAPDTPTLNEVKKYSKKNKKIKAIRDNGKGKPAALNQAFNLAKGEILILTDGDVYVGNNAVVNLLKGFSNKKIGAISGHPVSLNSRKNCLGYWSNLLTDIADRRRKKALKLRKKFYCSGYLFALRKGIVKEIPEETLSDDGFISYLVYENGFKIGYSPEAKVYVKFPTTISDWLNQKKRSAGGYNQIKSWTKKEMRSFTKESSGIFQVLSYPKTFRELFWTFKLILIRIYLWIIIYRDINLRKKDFEEIWVRIDSTK